jgi:hypothetical protein
MITFLARALLAVAAMVAGWFVETSSPQFGLMQIAVGLLLLVFVVWVIAFWPERWTIALNGRDKKR